MTNLELSYPDKPIFTKRNVGLGLVGIVGVGFLINYFAPESPVFEDIPAKEIEDTATQMFSERLNEVDVKTRIAVQYGSLSGEVTVDKTKRDNKTGKLDYSPKDFDFGQNCLEGTGFDIAPSEISTWFGGGDINSNATVTEGPDGEAVLGSGSSADGVLRFLITEQGSLMPFDDATRGSLEFNGCDPNYDPLVNGPIAQE